MHNKKKITLLLLAFMMIIPAFYRYGESVKAEDNENNISDIDNTHFIVMDKEGNVEYIEYNNEAEPLAVSDEDETYQVVSVRGEDETVLGEYDTYEEASEAMEKSKYYRSAGDVMVKANNTVRTTNYGLARLKNQVIYYTEVDSGRTGYIHGGTAADAAYISTSADGRTIRIKVSGVVMDVAAGYIAGIETNVTDDRVSFYEVDNGVLYHASRYYSGSGYPLSYARVGFKQSYMQEGATYYSYDGHYFYTSYTKMLDDYRNGNYSNAINSGNPYYNYYQYLSHHTKTNFSVNSLNSFLNAGINGRTSALTSQGQAFVTSQNTYTVNAGLMLGVAINETGWGMSDYALKRNNLFGHAAYDSDPDQATYYKSILDSINGHAYDYVSRGYLNAIDERYCGPHLGDKHSGLNVAYASDGYWGEKAASHMWKLTSSDNSDFGRYTIGILTSGEQWFYKEANPNSKAIYSSATMDGAGLDQVYDFPVTILDVVTGTDGKKWYKIISDTPLTEDRNQLATTAVFKSTRDYVYIPASSTTVVYNGSGLDIPNDIVLKGDVNGDGQITPSDYVKIKNHIMGSSLLSGRALEAADANGDGKVTPADYVKVKNIIMGR